MAVITFANTKGGAGKTTAALLLTTELLHRNYRVCVIDADPQRWFSKWYEGAALMPRLSVETYVSAPTIQKIVHERRSQWDFVIVDLQPLHMRVDSRHFQCHASLSSPPSFFSALAFFLFGPFFFFFDGIVRRVSIPCFVINLAGQ